MGTQGSSGSRKLVFDERLARLSPEEFMGREVLVGKLNVAAVAAGEDFTFGHEGRGTHRISPSGRPPVGDRIGDDKVPPVLVGWRESFQHPEFGVFFQAGDVEAAARPLGPSLPFSWARDPGVKAGRHLGFHGQHRHRRNPTGTKGWRPRCYCAGDAGGRWGEANWPARVGGRLEHQQQNRRLRGEGQIRGSTSSGP